MKKNIDKIQEQTQNLKDLVFNPTVRILPGQIAFFLILSIFPLLMLVGCTSSIFNISVDSLVNFANEILPKEVVNIITEFITGKSFDSALGISMITGFILASNGSHAIILASNTLYGFPSDNYFKRRIKAIFLIVILVILFAFIMIVLAYGNLISRAIFEFLNMDSLTKNIYILFYILRWPLAMIMTYLAVKVVYVIAPDWHILAKNTSKGAFFTTVGWTIATAIFSYYVSHFANYDLIYGGLSNIIILMIWVYVLSYILVLGIAINVKEYKDKEEID